ncbi:MAG: KpsF/GutQ family sugar-phosphate isomerase [Saprospiraceae bacterium]|uniref:KpsF/GutQ family sugar-phosphate isomerase n=1 Tax=Candidatus Defluviibacterium haderslevense TaxID=2981993 RepID=A0A9D7XCK4_9BACT|nr:KpsF/GutQ family sugar-phosphate isomerase [Candidatus Defluviibacterium haderslevense]MBL0236088.1 KpsF/GutQ family sugar-phosphate isomerase [Candidatus Defluviibacterium haderslevense]
MTESIKKSIQESALSCINIEAQVIAQLHTSVNDAFIQAIYSIYQSPGRLVITGIGKSAIIGQKIVATLNSTGTPALFMHAADAIHGDLGMVQSNDIVLCISKSGETPEIKLLVPLVKGRGSLLIGICAQAHSFLALQSDYLIYTPVSQEAEPNNLAPTSSTTAQLVIGDAIAVALISLRGFSQLDFAHYHPGGSLGKKLHLKVDDLYRLNDKPKVALNATFHDTLIEISSKRLGATVVMDELEEIAGMVTDGDIRRAFEKYSDVSKLTAETIMNKNPKMISAEAMATDALQVMQDNKISQLVVLENDKYVGIIHLHDILREGII